MNGLTSIEIHVCVCMCLHVLVKVTSLCRSKCRTDVAKYRTHTHIHTCSVRNIKEHLNIFQLFEHTLFYSEALCLFFFKKPNRRGTSPIAAVNTSGACGPWLNSQGTLKEQRREKENSCGRRHQTNQTASVDRRKYWVFVTNMIRLPLLTSRQVDNHLVWELHEANLQAGPDIHPHNYTGWENKKDFKSWCKRGRRERQNHTRRKVWR